MNNLYDVIVVGGGPAGLTAALYLARAQYRVLVLEKDQMGGQIAITHEVVNYPGVEKISGKALTETMVRQAERFGAEFLQAEAVGYGLEDAVKTVRTDKGDYQCLGILLATGAQPRSVGFKGEETYKGRGVAYCATCDGEFFTGKEIFVVGGGYAAAEESVFLTKFAKHVTILIRRDDFSCAASVSEPAKNNPKITVLTNTVLEEVSGENGLTYARYRNTLTGKVTEYKNRETFGVFVLAGHEPATANLAGVVDLDQYGYIVTDSDQRTTVEGVYAAGDVCVKPLRQVVTATGDGALAATELEKYVAYIHRKTGLKADRVEKKTAEQVAVKSPRDNALLSADMQQQLHSVFARMERPLVLKLWLDQRPISQELKRFVEELTELTPKLTMQIVRENGSSQDCPCVRLFLADGQDSGLRFHGVPGGHEFTSFVLGLYNASGPGQAIDDVAQQQIQAIDRPVDIKILVTLSCSMCPDTVVAAQRIAAANPKVSAAVYDVRHFEKLREKYQVMSVPCLVINDEKTYFGKKNISQILAILGE